MNDYSNMTFNNTQNADLGFLTPAGPIEETLYKSEDDILIRKESSKQPTPLLTISTIFPFDLVPDTVLIDEHKVNIIHREIGGEQVHSVLIEDITDLVLERSPIAASLLITDSSTPRFPYQIRINNLKLAEAKLARDLIQGLIKAKKTNTDLSKFEIEELKTHIKNLGGIESKNQNIKISHITQEEIPVSHYYGDTIRLLFLISGGMMLITIPFFYKITPVPFLDTLFIILLVSIFSGLINPSHIWSVFVSLVLSIIGFVISEVLAFSYLTSQSNIAFGLVNQAIALTFFTAIYYGTKSLRGSLLVKW